MVSVLVFLVGVQMFNSLFVESLKLVKTSITHLKYLKFV